jgi:hypothetical protein
MGRVYLGYSPGGRAVAVKVVHPELARDPEFMTRFQREAEAAAAVGGVYTAPVISAGPADHPPWLATAYVPGPSLADYVARSGPLPDGATWKLAGGLAEALQAIHAKGLVHRDLKPGNILLATDGPRVIDFGISRALMGTQVTAAQTTMGTPAFMSPEQVQGRDVGPASDIFALGSVLAYAATGVAPFDGGASYSILYKVVGSEPDLGRLTEGPYGPSGPGLRAIVAACLAKDPARRPSLEQLITGIATATGAFPPVAAGTFWPQAVTASIESRTVAITALPGPPGQPGPTRGYTGPQGYTGAQGYGGPPGYPGQQAPTGQQGLPSGGPVTPVPGYATPAHVTTPPTRRSGPRWLLLTGAGVAAAIVIGVVLALVLNSGPGGTPGPAAATAVGGVSSPATTGPATSAPASTAPASVPPASVPPASAVTTTSAPASASASPTSTLIAVTVCSDPADGCTQAGASQQMEVKPKEILVSGDGSGYVDGLTWSNWGGSQATATGTLKLNNCDPNCAQGTYTGYPAMVTVAGPKDYGTGLQAYSTIVVQSPAANQDYTYTKDTVP